MSDHAQHFHQTAVSNIGQILSSFVTWYTFFWTLNVGALGWIYSEPVADRPPKQVLLGAVILFAILNAMGVAVCLVCRSAVVKLTDDATKLAKQMSGVSNDERKARAPGLIPSGMIAYVFVAGAVSLLLNVCAWLALQIYQP